MSTYSNCNNSLSVGDIIKFGNYFINDDTTKEPIEWRVLEVSNDKALLITKDAIDCKPYNYEMRNITWENCTLRQWLNNEFINQAFSKEEQEEILLTNLSNPDNFEYEYRTKGGNNTQDKIFLLSIDEAEKYFKVKCFFITLFIKMVLGIADIDRTCKVTSYAKKQGVRTDNDKKYLGNCFWWLRSPGSTQNRAAFVSSVGFVNDYGCDVYVHHGAVRPALWINL